MKPKLTFEEHLEMGRALKVARNDLLNRQVTLANAYPRSGQPGVPSKKLEAAVRAIDEARSALDNAVFNEHPGQADTKVYYPNLDDD
ncbi:hypothetical protein ACH4GG_27365 [Streptomyces albidoflavus]|uniref:hypothetical protein n=2 Tax=Streptomyces TaxID=1883 RepID=UPI00101E63CD|nr:hypothetical protein [Streptomyces albidoflavus]